MDNDAVCASGVWGGTLTDEADPPPPEHATAPHTIAATASAPHPARHHRPRRRPDEPDDNGAPDDDAEPHDADEPGDPPHDTAESDGTGVDSPDGRTTGNHDTEELLPQGP